MFRRVLMVIAVRPKEVPSVFELSYSSELHMSRFTKHPANLITSSTFAALRNRPHTQITTKFRVKRANMSGVTESSQGTHSARQPNAQEKKIIDDILCLYQLKPSHQAYSHYAETAVFHDPVSIAKGLDSIKSQFNGMPKLFAESTTESMSGTNTICPNLLTCLRMRRPRLINPTIPPTQPHAKIRLQVRNTVQGKGRSEDSKLEINLQHEQPRIDRGAS